MFCGDVRVCSHYCCTEYSEDMLEMPGFSMQGVLHCCEQWRDNCLPGLENGQQLRCPVSLGALSASFIYICGYIYDTSSTCIIFTAALYQLTSLITLIDNFSLGFTGTLCAENINNCDPDPCHHGECQDGIDSYTCICNPGYMGAICSEQIDECHSNPCLHQGRCIDLVNGYQCNCLLGTSGT